MLCTYCLEFERDWDEGVPLLLFAVREVIQESVGFNLSWHLKYSVLCI